MKYKEFPEFDGAIDRVMQLLEEQLEEKLRSDPSNELYAHILSNLAELKETIRNLDVQQLLDTLQRLDDEDLENLIFSLFWTYGRFSLLQARRASTSKAVPLDDKSHGVEQQDTRNKVDNRVHKRSSEKPVDHRAVPDHSAKYAGDVYGDPVEPARPEGNDLTTWFWFVLRRLNDRKPLTEEEFEKWDEIWSGSDRQTNDLLDNLRSGLLHDLHVDRETVNQFFDWLQSIRDVDLRLASPPFTDLVESLLNPDSADDLRILNVMQVLWGRTFRTKQEKKAAYADFDKLWPTMWTRLCQHLESLNRTPEEIHILLRIVARFHKNHRRENRQDEPIPEKLQDIAAELGVTSAELSNLKRALFEALRSRRPPKPE